MPLIYNGTVIANVIYNGVTLDNLIYNGVEVFSSAPAITATPNITDYYFGSNKLHWKVQNLDTETVTIYSEHNDITPDLYVASGIVSGGKTPEYAPFSLSGQTVYAKAQASGKELSAYDSQYVG